ncbi:hypothetical protein [Arenimonas sp. MALMAid1274]|uniref:hypothetical protein n=1 Tax=Arenimonas sp. MALMAid1274 TaxID=3411630 RepID=UPI003BA202CC
MKTTLPAANLLAIAVLLAACGGQSTPRPEADLSSQLGLPEPLPPPALDDATQATAPVDAFLASLSRYCGQAFAGRVRVDEPASADNAFAGKALVMHVRGCGERELRIPFHVGDDHSRTWVLTRTASGLRLKHDHRHEDGSPDPVTMYGGDSRDAGTAQRQAFPVDADSVAMFQREGLSASVTNTWAMEVGPGPVFVYELSRPGGRLFQVEFDLSRPVPLPPAPWGSEP